MRATCPDFSYAHESPITYTEALAALVSLIGEQVTVMVTGASALRGAPERKSAVGFKQRERKRKAKAAMTAAQTRARESGSCSSKWWLTVVSTDTCCARGGEVLRVGREMVYRASPREALCVPCADRRAVLPAIGAVAAGATEGLASRLWVSASNAEVARARALAWLCLPPGTVAVIFSGSAIGEALDRVRRSF